MLRRTTCCCCANSRLEAAGVPYAVAGGNCGLPPGWRRVDPALRYATRRMSTCCFGPPTWMPRGAERRVGRRFVRRHVAGIDVFLDGPKANQRADAVHIVPAGVKIRPRPCGDVAGCHRIGKSRTNFALSRSPRHPARMKLVSFRDKDRTHLRDLLDVGLIDESWVARFPPELGARLQQLIDTPEG